MKQFGKGLICAPFSFSEDILEEGKNKGGRF